MRLKPNYFTKSDFITSDSYIGEILNIGIKIL